MRICLHWCIQIMEIRSEKLDIGKSLFLSLLPYSALFCPLIPFSMNTDSKPKYPVRVSVSEAARLFGVDAHTIRRAIKNQELRYIVVQSRYKINFESLVQWSQNRTTVKNKLENKGIGQFVETWKIKAKKFSPSPLRSEANPDAINPKKEEKNHK